MSEAAATKAAPAPQRQRAKNNSVVGELSEAPAQAVLRLDPLPWQSLAGIAMLAVFVGGLLGAHLPTFAVGPDNEIRALYLGARGEATAGLSDMAALRLPALRMLLKPLTLLPYAPAALLWLVLSFWAAMLFVGVWRPSPAASNLFAMTLSAPLFLALLEGRETPFLLAAAALSAWAVRRNRDFIAGLFLSLALLTPQFFFLIPILPLAQRRLRLGMGLLAGVAGLLGLSSLAAPPDWPLDTLGAILLRSGQSEAWSEPTLRALLLPIQTVGYWALAAGCALGVLVVAARVSYPVALGAALAGGLLTSPFAVTSDALLLLPLGLATFTLAQSWRLRGTALLVLCPLLYVFGEPYSPVAVAGATMVLLALSAFEAMAAPEPDAGQRA